MKGIETLALFVTNYNKDLYLLLPCSSPTSHTIEVNGRLWSLRNFSFDHADDWTGPGYACISYTWGTGREPSTFDSSFLVSDRTVPALQSFTRHRPDCSGIWVDAFCVPLTEPERAQTFESMGYIYSQADEVVIVLSSAALPALASVLNSNRLDVTDLAVLEGEEWVKRAWTCQEAVNSKTMFMTCEGEGSPVVQVYQLFSCLGYAMTHLNGSIVDSLRVYPRLNAFEDIMADYYTADYEE